ncbi:MAG: DinB family protein [Anaerolineae bacterium]
MTRRKLDFTPIKNKDITFNELAATLNIDDLRELTDGMVDTMLDLIADCVDEDVTFQPLDPDADDTYAADEAEKNIAWTLGHVIVHTTASAEESAASAAELARGVAHHGRSRSEAPWRTVTTIRQCRERLEESRRMRLASLEMWPDHPHLDNTYTPFDLVGEVNAIGAFVLGLFHDDSHLEQIAKIVRQAKAAKEGLPAQVNLK